MLADANLRNQRRNTKRRGGPDFVDKEERHRAPVREYPQLHLGARHLVDEPLSWVVGKRLKARNYGCFELIHV